MYLYGQLLVEALILVIHYDDTLKSDNYSPQKSFHSIRILLLTAFLSAGFNIPWKDFACVFSVEMRLNCFEQYLHGNMTPS